MVGMLASTMILSFFNINRKGLTLVLGLVGLLIAALLFSQVADLTILTMIVFFIGFAMSFVYIPFFTAAQEQTDNCLMGRVMSIIFLAMNGFDPIAYGIVSMLNTMGISIQMVILAFATIGLMITLLITFKAKDYVRN